VAATAGDSSEFEENEKLRAELKAALELAERLQLERDEAQLDTFESNLRGMSGTGSESAAGGDVTRRGAPPPVEDKSLLLQWPEPSPVALQAAWSQLCDRLGSSGAAAAAPAQGSFEVRRMHPPMRDTLLAAMDAGKCQLRFWTGVIAADSVPSNKMKSDFMFTHLRDRLSSLLGAAVLVEVKSPGDMQNAITQAGNYARRRMREVFAAARLRGDVALHELAVWAVATDGREVVIMRVMSGAPKPGGSYKDAVPCPSSISPPLPLLGEWDFAAASGALSHTPPAGFAALARVLCADADALLGATTAPLTSVLAELQPHDASPAAAQQAGAPLELRLGARLGCGGSSDAYEVVSALGAPQAACASGTVLKIARGATEKLGNFFAAEAGALRTLAGTPGVPRLLFTGNRHRGDPGSARVKAFPAAWPLLLMSPVGAPLDVELAARLRAALAAGGPPAASVRRAFADEVLAGVHVALRAAHAAGVVHCDVRPTNCVVAGGAPLLLDWGLCRAAGADAAWCGDALFTLDAVFRQQSYAACAWQDLAAAALLWVAVAYGAGDTCSAPWPSHSHADRTLEARGKWLRAAADAGDASLRAATLRLERAAARHEPTAADYEWLPPR
jgi:hypothetical protein